jgi:GT2 family glycosyltransferase
MRNYNTPLVSFVIVTYDPTASFLKKTLKVLAAQTYKEFEIVIVDSGKEKLSSLTAQEWSISTSIPITYVSIKPNGSKYFNYSHAYNVGVRKAKGKIIVRLSGDAVPIGKTWLRRSIDHMNQKHVGIVSGGDFIKNKLEFNKYLLSVAYDKMRVMVVQPHTTNVHKFFPFVNGPCIIFAREIWSKHKFNEEWLWGEEFEFASWALQKGYHIVFDPDIKIAHSHRLDTKNALARISNDIAFAFKMNIILRDQVVFATQELFKEGVVIPFSQFEKTRQYFISQDQVKYVGIYLTKVNTFSKKLFTSIKQIYE